MLKSFFASIVALFSFVAFATPVSAQCVMGCANGNVTGATWVAPETQNAPVLMNPTNGQYVQNGQVYQPQQTQNINIRTSGCQNSLGNAIACIGAQTVGQILVNRSAVREQRDATIAVARATTFQPAGQYQQPIPIGQCVGLNGQQITVFQGQDPNQICR